jgi:hypothetical protein
MWLLLNGSRSVIGKTNSTDKPKCGGLLVIPWSGDDPPMGTVISEALEVAQPDSIIDQIADLQLRVAALKREQGGIKPK